MSLVSFGFRIEQHPYRGAAYVGPAERLCPDQIEHELATRWLGRRIVVWNRVTSTNDLAIRAGDSRSNNGLVILAEEQTSGRGRQGRSWTAPPRSSILMSVLLFPPPHLMPGDSAARSGQAWLTALGAIATAEVVSSWTGRNARIKWPNDVRVEGRKIAGILVERSVSGRSRCLCRLNQPPSRHGAARHRHRLERQPAPRRLFPPRASRPRGIAPDRARRCPPRSIRVGPRPDPPARPLVRLEPRRWPRIAQRRMVQARPNISAA